MNACKASRAVKLPALLTSLILAGLAAGFTASTGSSQIIYNNLGASSTGADQVLYFGPLFNSFTPASDEILTGVRLALANYGPPGGSNTLNIGLYTLSTLDDYAVPTLITNLGAISNSAIVSGLQDYTVSLLVHPELKAGTRYWIGLTDYDDGYIQWSWSADISGPGQAGEYWAEDGGVVKSNSIPGPYQMSLTVSPVPLTNGVIYNNLGAASGGADQILYFGPLFDSFTPASDETISGLQLALENSGPSVGSNTLSVGLYTLSTLDDDAVPTLIATLGTISNSTIAIGGIYNYSVSITAYPLLKAGTRYWIGLTDYDDGSISWSWSSDTSGIGVAGEYWANDGGNVHPNSVQGPYQMTLAATPTPPMLTIAPSGQSLVVSWPNTGNYILQQNSDFSMPSNWTSCGYSVTTNSSSGTNSITITEPAGTMFFRLATPPGM